jgi:NAD(P)H-hydrate repair Nnr-like enzyme with NAD(P)H-hydrate epimerase domain
MESPNQPLFRTESNYLFPGVTTPAFQGMLNELINGYGFTYPQICEAASYSMAMVVRVALGLSADRAIVGAIVTDNLSGWVTLASLRHLRNGGSECYLILAGEQDTPSTDFALQLKPLQKMGMQIHHWTSPDQNPEMTALVLKCHALICGLAGSQAAAGKQYDYIINTINELKTPVHCIQMPPGVDRDTGERTGAPVFASSTLSLGAPLAGLHKGADFAGRHYICDISFTNELYTKEGYDLTPLFAEQPVIQVFPATAADA